MTRRPLDALPNTIPENPAPSERTYFRNNKTGERGYLVTRSGIVMIRYDRPNEEIVRPMSELEWSPDLDTRPLSRSSVAMIAHEADRALCKSLGRTRDAKRTWADLPEEVKKNRVEGVGPQQPPIRKELFESTWRLLIKNARDV